MDKIKNQGWNLDRFLRRPDEALAIAAERRPGITHISQLSFLEQCYYNGIAAGIAQVGMVRNILWFSKLLEMPMEEESLRAMEEEELEEVMERLVAEGRRRYEERTASSR
jgi:hypothetical protein